MFLEESFKSEFGRLCFSLHPLLYERKDFSCLFDY